MRKMVIRESNWYHWQTTTTYVKMSESLNDDTKSVREEPRELSIIKDLEYHH
jgi:hypothetical protein